MTLAIVWICVGLAALIAGAELLVRSGSALAARLGVSPLLIGLTVVALGTSTPELAVGIDAAVQGNGSLAVGNIAGTNTVNILLILGLSAALRPLAIQMQTLRLELPVIVIASATLLAFAWDGTLSRLEGLLLVTMGAAFTLAVIRVARQESIKVKLEFAREYGPRRLANRQAATEMLMLAAGLVIIVAGADWLVEGAVGLARLWRVSDAFIGLTIVAIGTSAPELVTTIISTFRGERDIAIGNLIGSSVYNILVILGVTCLIPADGIDVNTHLIGIDIPVMLGVALFCIPVFVSGRKITRGEGGLFVSAYVAYLSYLIIQRA
ncbi:sodium:calcium antiporter [Sphingobium sp. GW456-12-10-14-TSB1]|jgi:cation:H+ antiporter|uniref:Calcium/sodium antiporter n=2 Tax=Novosphingobium TaxID=165696 RepID=A0A7X4GHC7_9SPHN|nr:MULTISPECIES: calcium/sodium antiporter [Sphingomonadaceae]MBS88234.1 sodium:calcium antiporter [Sphingobium sp.]MYL97817.1 calcium/sodium antiporter [Novosphingobium silvae]OUC54530.1 sodium:calcium antiporter [Sphingobium sp. GW456-12-10-14-TSB1]